MKDCFFRNKQVNEVTAVEDSGKGSQGGRGGNIAAVYDSEDHDNTIGWIFALTDDDTKHDVSTKHEALCDSGACHSVCPASLRTTFA